MAKETILETDNLDLDYNLDFDFDPENSIRSKVSKEAKDKKSRTPVQETFSGILSEAKSKLKDPGFLAKVTKKALPDQYGELIDSLDKGAGTLSSIYEETLRDLKPQLIKLNKSVDKIVPDEQRFLKKITSRIKETLGEETQNSFRNSNEQLKEQSINNSLSDIFQQQRDFDINLQARKSAEEKISQSVEEVRYAKNLDIFQTISDNTIRLTSYTEKVTQAFQKKSLELQFRNYFAVSELLQEYRKNSEVRKLQTDSIVKNTALPEYVKVNNNERFQDLARNKLFNSVQDKLFGDQSVIGIALNNLKTQAKDFTSGFKSSLENVNFGLQGVQDLKEQQQMLKELGMESPSKYQMLGNVLGSELMDFLGSKVSSKVKSSINENSKFSKFGYKAADFVNNLNPNIKNLRNSNFINDNSFSGGLKGSLAGIANFGLDLFNTNGADLRLGSNNITDLSSATSFDKRSRITVTDIIPGYLSRIHRELLALRTNNPNAEQTVFDYRSGKFTTSTKLTNDIKRSISSTIKGSSYNYFLDKSSKDLLGETNLDKDQLNKVKSFLTDISNKDILFTPEAIRKTEEFKSLDKTTAKIVSDMLDKNITNSDNKEKSQYDFTNSILRLRNATPNIKKEILEHYNLGHGEILEQQGIITINEKGEAKLNFDKYKQFIKDQSILGLDSGEEITENTKQSNRRNRSFTSRRSSIQEPRPIRQVVNNNLNKEIIDELINQLNTLIKEQDNILLGVKDDTSGIRKILETYPKFGSGGNKETTSEESIKTRYRTGNTYKDMFLNLLSDTIDVSAKIGRDIFKGASSITGQANIKIVKPIDEFITKLYKDNKDDTVDLFKRIFKSGSELAISAINFSKDIYNNFIPAKYKQLVNSVMNAKENILNFLEDPIDIYIKGIKTPVIRANLMKMGYYFDQETGQVINSIRDIKGPIVDKLGNVVLTIDDIKSGLFDMSGKEITSKITNLGKLVAGLALEGITRVKNFGLNVIDAISSTNVGEKLKNLFSLPVFLGDEKSYNVLLEIRDILKIIARVNVQNSDDPGAGNIRYSENNVLDTFLKKGKEAVDKRKQRKQNKESFNDKDRDGKRDGSYEERLEAINSRRKNRSTNKATQEDNKPEQRYRSSENIIDTIFSKAKGLMDMLTNGVGGIFDIATSILGKTSGIAGAIGKVVKAPVTAIGSILGAGKLATGISGIASAARNTIVAASIAITGTGSAILGAAGVVLSGLTAILTSPVTLGIVATAAAGYGIYKGYKYFTKDKIDKFQDIRIKQYGLTNSNEDVEYNHTIIELEDYLVSQGVIGYRGGAAYLLTRKFDTAKVLSIFSIDPKDSESVNNFQLWFNKRFKPFFLTNVTALYSINNKANLQEINKLDINEQIRYLELVSFESGPYDELTSPFKSKYELTNTKKLVSDTIKDLLQSLTKERIKSNKDDTKAKNLSRKVINNTITSKGMVVEEIDVNRMINKNLIDKNTKVDFNISEDGGKETKVSESITNKISSITNVKDAVGSINDGGNAGQYINLSNGVKLDGVNPTMLQQLKGMIQEYGELTGKSVTIESGYRSPQDQARLYKQNSKKAAKPGTSLHEFGLAVDMDRKALAEMEDLGLMRKYGFTRPVGGEPWHIEAAGIQANIRGAKEDSNLANQLIAASINKGGGGIGTIPNSPLGKRDTQYAMKLMDIKPTMVDPSRSIDQSKDLISTSTNVVSSNTNSDIRRVSLTGGFTDSISNVNKNTLSKENGYISGGIASDGETKPVPKNVQEVKKQIADVSKDIGADPNKMQAFAAVESSLDPFATNGNAKGLYQFMPKTFSEQAKESGLGSDADPTDVEDSTIAANNYMKKNVRNISSVKPDANLTDMYLSHFAGPNGAKKLLSVLKSNPNETAANVLPNAAKGNRNLFYKNNRALTVAEFYNNMSSLLENKSRSFGITTPFGESVKETNKEEVSATVASNNTSPNTKVSSNTTNNYSQFSALRTPEITTSNVSDGGFNGILNVTKSISATNEILVKSLEVQHKTLDVLTEFVDLYKNKSNKDLDNKGGVQNVKNDESLNVRNREIVSAVDINRKAS